MFTPEIYLARRNLLKKSLETGIILLLGHKNCPINYQHMVYPFRQDSTFLYYFGLNIPNLIGVIDIDQDAAMVFGDSLRPEDLAWIGQQLPLAKQAEQVGITVTKKLDLVPQFLAEARKNKRPIHTLPTYRDDSFLTLMQLLPDQKVSQALVEAVINQRILKSVAEVAEIKAAIKMTGELLQTAKKMVRDRIYEYEILAEFNKMVTQYHTRFAFPPIISTHGEFLHNPNYHEQLTSGQFLVIDVGVESSNHYSADITRTYAVNSWAPEQQAIYEIVAKTKQAAIAKVQVGAKLQDVHFNAAKDIFNGLKALGLTQGDTETAIQEGAHKLFFPHRIGHLLGLDTHDLSALKPIGMDITLKAGMCLTIEPGIYFVPAIIAQWETMQRHRAFINYPVVKKFSKLGGIRLEDDILLTCEGPQNLSFMV